MTYPKENLQQLLKDGIYFRVAKMREVNALGLQQNFTSDYSRVGQRAILPSVFKTPIELAYLSNDERLIKLPSKEVSQGLCYVGSKNKKAFLGQYTQAKMLSLQSQCNSIILVRFVFCGHQ